MSTNKSKRETLKLYRIHTRGNIYTQASYVQGYRNVTAEYSQYNVPGNAVISVVSTDSGSITSTTADPKFGALFGPSPARFLADHGFPEDADFIIESFSVKYDRSNPSHDLDSNETRIWVVTGNSNTSSAVTVTLASDPTQSSLLYIAIPATNETLEFDVNPNSINIVKKKLFQKIRTRGGWAFQHWGPDIGEIQLDGVTRNITPPPKSFYGPPDNNDRGPKNNHANFDLQIPDETNSPVFAAFRLLEKWYDEDQGEQAQRDGLLLALEFRGRIYVGHIATFTYNETGTKPFQLSYKLTFMVHYDSGALGDATVRAQAREIRNQTSIDQIKKIQESGGNNAAI